jgi:UDP-GlcNAc3NAcA epimerase
MTGRLLTIVGARPQFIKAAPVSRALAAAGIDEIVVHSGQHYDDAMSGAFFRELGLRAPDVQLQLGGGSQAAMIGRMLGAFEDVLRVHAPERVLVYGDTNTTFAGALAAATLGIPVAHVEAGLRSGDATMPEEINRTLTDRVADLLFTPTPLAQANLRREGRPDAIWVGDVMLDALQQFLPRARAPEVPLPDAFALVTLHRAAATDDAATLARIVAGLARVHRDLPLVLPLHPRTRAALARFGLAAPGIVLPPLGYLAMLALLQRARLVITDSGGVQKEAYYLARPCVVLRDRSEWRELEAGGHDLVGSDPAAIAAAAIRARARVVNPDLTPFGSGRAALRIAAELAR